SQIRLFRARGFSQRLLSGCLRCGARHMSDATQESVPIPCVRTLPELGNRRHRLVLHPSVEMGARGFWNICKPDHRSSSPLCTGGSRTFGLTGMLVLPQAASESSWTSAVRESGEIPTTSDTSYTGQWSLATDR